MLLKNQSSNVVECWLVTIFVLCLFYGDVHFRVVFPLSMAVLPVLLVFVIAKRRTVASGFNLGIGLLVGVLLAIGFGMLAGGTAPVRSDIGTYGPIMYAIVTAFTFSLVRIPDAVLWRALVLGGFICAITIGTTIAILPDGEYLVPGQNYAETDHEYRQTKSPGRDVTKFVASPATQIGDMDDKSVRPFYNIKNKIRNSLGRSNYLGVFFVFVFSVALFRGNHIVAMLFAAATIATLSRFGAVFLIMIWLIKFGQTKKIRFHRLILPFFCSSIAVVTVVSIWPEIFSGLPGSQSIYARLEFWQSGLQPILDHPFFGSPRSAILDQYHYLLIWNPHNSLLWVGSLFGLFGLACYVAYIFVTMRCIYRRAEKSPMWFGVFIGILAALLWSMLEIIVLTPAFEILLGMLFGLSRSRPMDEPAASVLLPHDSTGHS